MAELTGKCCLVTGGSRGIGRAIALEFGRHGDCVAVTYSTVDVGHAHEGMVTTVTPEIAGAGGQA